MVTSQPQKVEFLKFKNVTIHSLIAKGKVSFLGKGLFSSASQICSIQNYV